MGLTGGSPEHWFEPNTYSSQGWYYPTAGGLVGARPWVQWGGVPGASGKWLLLPPGRTLSFLTSSLLPLPACLLSARSLLQGMGGSPISLLISNGSPGIAGHAAPCAASVGLRLVPLCPSWAEPAVAVQREGHPRWGRKLITVCLGLSSCSTERHVLGVPSVPGEPGQLVTNPAGTNSGDTLS